MAYPNNNENGINGSQVDGNTTSADDEEGADLEAIEATITTKAPKAVAAGAKPAGWSITLENPFASKSLKELMDIYGEERILNYAVAQLTVRFQAGVRSLAKAGTPDAEIAEKMAGWKPGDKLVQNGTSIDSIVKNFGNMTPEQQAQLFAKLEAARAAKA